jgi:hypothetical protein
MIPVAKSGYAQRVDSSGDHRSRSTTSLVRAYMRISSARVGSYMYALSSVEIYQRAMYYRDA